jgi:uncharacterized protein (DUF1697 family)
LLSSSIVKTFLVSGSFFFETTLLAVPAPEDKIGILLHGVLGFPVATFQRNKVKVAEIAAYLPFKSTELQSVSALNIAFLSHPLDEQNQL